MTHDIPALTLLGPLALRIGPRRQKLPFAGHTRRLFVLLAGHANVALRRDMLLDELWAGVAPARAQSGLNTAIWRIKKGLLPFEGFGIDCVDDLVRLSLEPPARLDSRELEQAVAQAGAHPILSPEARARLLTAVKCCRGPFLDGCADHWVLPLRERFAALHIRALSLLMRDRAGAGDYDAALDHGRAILALDPFREGTQREVIWLYALNGQRAQAIRQYRDLSALLQRELSIAPMPETEALFRKITQAQVAMHRIAADSVTETSRRSSRVPEVCFADPSGSLVRH